jgi:hypothetical protein
VKAARGIPIYAKIILKSRVIDVCNNNTLPDVNSYPELIPVPQFAPLHLLACSTKLPSPA